ncbi:MAG: S-layer domain protein [Candidatus Peregrinibacteria bacterium GW2011_GWA2_33_10]|nr:MAG: S-layer domain protein [Candidatus Peregrinibacteria bacterium GW2011_GWA2_33_10]
MSIQASFSDSQKHRFRIAIAFAKQNGFVKGFSDNTYRPDLNINRAEFLKVFIESQYSDKSSGENCFIDIRNEWFSPYVCAAKRLRIVDGYPDDTFKPDHHINQAEALKIVLNSFNYKIRSPKKNEEWYVPYVEVGREQGMFTRMRENPERKITRAEMAEIIYRLNK